MDTNKTVGGRIVEGRKRLGLTRERIVFGMTLPILHGVQLELIKMAGALFLSRLFFLSVCHICRSK